MDIVDIARKAGMTIVLDAKIGREEYRTVHGSVTALARFAELVSELAKCEPAEQD
jgi:hypothetical protein